MAIYKNKLSEAILVKEIRTIQIMTIFRLIQPGHVIKSKDQQYIVFYKDPLDGFIITTTGLIIPLVMLWDFEETQGKVKEVYIPTATIEKLKDLYPGKFGQLIYDPQVKYTKVFFTEEIPNPKTFTEINWGRLVVGDEVYDKKNDSFITVLYIDPGRQYLFGLNNGVYYQSNPNLQLTGRRFDPTSIPEDVSTYLYQLLQEEMTCS